MTTIGKVLEEKGIMLVPSVQPTKLTVVADAPPVQQLTKWQQRKEKQKRHKELMAKQAAQKELRCRAIAEHKHVEAELARLRKIFSANPELTFSTLTGMFAYALIHQLAKLRNVQDRPPVRTELRQWLKTLEVSIPPELRH